MKLLSIDVSNGSKLDTLWIDHHRVLIGTAAHCDIRLGVHEAEPEHVILEVENGIVRARAVGTRPHRAMLDNVPFTEAIVQPNARMTIGATSFTIAVAEPPVGHVAAPPRAPATSRWRLFVLGPIAAVLMLVIVLEPTGSANAATPPKNAPALWDVPVERCPIGPMHAPDERARLLSVGREARRVGEAKRQRYP